MIKTETTPVFPVETYERFLSFKLKTKNSAVAEAGRSIVRSSYPDWKGAPLIQLDIKEYTASL